MASPPSAGISLPNKRPLSNMNSAGSPPAMNSQPPAKRRKPSAQLITTNPSHLRQSSFPVDSVSFAGSPSAMSALSPPDTSTPGFFSREASIDSASASVSARNAGGPGSIISARSATTPGVGRRKKGKRGTRAGTAAASEANGDGGAGEDGGVVYMEDMPEDKDEDDAELAAAAQLATLEGGQMSEAQKKQEKKHLQMLLERFNDVDMDRYVLWKRFKINKAHVRRLINYSLSQSVPATVVTAVNGCAKIFVVDLIERALKVQKEWQAAAATLPTGEALDDDAELSERTKMIDRGPLTPNHLREALRRYKKERVGGSAGVMGVSLSGLENTAPSSFSKNVFRKM